MAKTFGGSRKWTTGRSRVTRPTDQSKIQRGVRESIKITFDRLNPFLRKK
jgi:hypothetical protein